MCLNSTHPKLQLAGAGMGSHREMRAVPLLGAWSESQSTAAPRRGAGQAPGALASEPQGPQPQVNSTPSTWQTSWPCHLMLATALLWEGYIPPTGPRAKLMAASPPGPLPPRTSQSCHRLRSPASSADTASCCPIKESRFRDRVTGPSTQHPPQARGQPLQQPAPEKGWAG